MADVKISDLPTKTVSTTDMVPVVDDGANTTSRVTVGDIVGLVTDASQLATGTLQDSLLSANVVLTNDSRLSDARTPTSHTHAISDVTNLQTSLDGKASSSHNHAISDVTGLQTALDGKQASGSYAAASHTHAVSDLTQSAATSNQVIAWSGSAWAPATVAYANVSGTPTLATVATSGSYDDLSNKPTIPTLGRIWALS